MELENKDKIVEHLKQIMLTHIESNERNAALSKKVLNRLILIVIMAATSVLIGIIIVIYMLLQTENKNKIAWENIEAVNKYMIEQRNFIKEDRQDAATARAQNAETADHLNVMSKRMDSLLNVNYKRAIR